MDVVVKARRGRVSGQARQRVERKLARLSRLEAGIQRVEVELIEQANRRVDGGHRVEAAARTSRRTFRASGSGPDVAVALDRVVERLERQLTDHRGRRRARLIGGANRVKSGAALAGRPRPADEVPEP